MKNKGKRILSVLAVLAVTLGSVTAIYHIVPATALQSVGERALLLSAGLRQPAHGVQLFEGWLTRDTAAGSPSTTVTAPPNVSVGEGSTQVVTTKPTATVPARQEGGGKVITQQMSAGDTFVKGVAVRNKSGKDVNIANSLAHTPALSLKKGSTQPQVLIMHTHTTECYMSYDAGYYNPNDPTRTNDSSKNMVAVGKRVADELKAAGIAVLHDTEIHDQPYDSAYGHSKAAVEKYLKKYPSIRVVLDLHRDAIYQDSTTPIKPTVTINGKKAAQLMIIVGMRNTKAVPNTHTAENLAFGVRLQQRLHERHPGLARPLLLADARYNQQLTNGSLLIEVGSHVNTLEEACYTGELLGNILGEVLQELGA